MQPARKRGRFVPTVATRPKDKNLITVNQTLGASTTDETVLFTASQACTIVGMRADLTYKNTGTSGNKDLMMGIVVYPGGAQGTYSTTDGNAFYEPEKYMWMFESVFTQFTNATLGDTRQHVVIDTRTARKVQKNDTISLFQKSMDGNNMNNIGVFGVVQFWCKE